MPISDVLRPSTPRRFDPAFAKMLVVLNGAVPLVLLSWDAFWHRLGLNAVNFAIHVTGLLGFLFLLLSLTVTPLRRLTGWNEIIAVRRALGLYAFLYLCVHFALFFAFDRSASIVDTAHEIYMRRYLQLGATGLALLFPLAITSTNAMVKRLGARRWKALHRLSYAVAVLGSVHYCLLVKADLRQPLAFAAVLAMLLGFRLAYHYLGGQARRAKHRAALLAASARSGRFWSGELEVTRVVKETPDVRTFRLGAQGGAPLPFLHRPGQYLNLLLTIDGKRVHRSYTIASSPTQRSYCEMTIKRHPLGLASRYLHDALGAGSRVRISAPAGRFVFTGVEADRVLLIAGGVGVTPLMAIIRYLTDIAWHGVTYLLFSVRTRQDVIFSEELRDLQRRVPNLHVCITLSGNTESSWTGERGRLSREMITRFVPNVTRLPVYLCGPEPMMTETRRLLLDLGLTESQIKTEAFISAAGPALERPGVDASAPTPDDMVRAREWAPPGTELSTINFRLSMELVEAVAGQTILEAAELAGVGIPFECRSGICGQCKTRLVAGRVAMDVQDALSAAESSAGLILACQARPTSDVTVDA